MKQVLYILKACDVVHCQCVFSCYARVIMLHLAYTTIGCLVLLGAVSETDFCFCKNNYKTGPVWIYS